MNLDIETDMNKKNFAIDSVLSIKCAVVFFNNMSVNLAKLIPNDFKGKVIINFEEIDNISDSFVCLKEDHDSILEVDLISSCHVKLNTIDNKVNNAYDIDYEVPKQEGRSLAIFTAVDIPYVARHNVPESKVDLVEVAKIINIYVVIYQGSCIELKKKNYQVFDSYSAFGFVILDIVEFDRFISSNTDSNDLINEFTSTELAGDIFEQGLMILSWANTPWVYYINSMNQYDINSLIGDDKGYHGIYKLKKSTRQYSVLPGYELKDWRACKQKEWPVIEISGDGDYVQLKLHVKNAYSQSDEDYPIPTFHITRLNNDVINPLLQSSIY